MMTRLRVFDREKTEVADCVGLVGDGDEVSKTNFNDQNSEEEKPY